MRSATLSGVIVVALAALAVACSDGASGSSTSTAGTTGGGGGGATGGAGGKGTGGTGTGGSTLTGGSGGGTAGPAKLEEVLAALRADRDGTLKAESAQAGWPLLTEQGWLFVSTDPQLVKLAGDHDQWAPEAMTPDQGFAWIVEPTLPDDDHYKFTDGQTYAADPWSRSIDYDTYGEISIARATAQRLDRWFGVGDAKLQERIVRVWVPAGPITRELYVHDGQNLFDPSAPWGGWHLQDTAPDGILLVGIDNSPARMDEYTQVPDFISGSTVGGKGDDYADFLQFTVRPLIQAQYGEPGPVGVMGSSLGGLISFEVAYRYPNDYAFAASLSGTMGWGSIGAGIHNQTMIERFPGGLKPVLYLDSGGEGFGCADADGDGINDDDPLATDNFCENAQMETKLVDLGYKEGTTPAQLYYWHEPGAEHNEAAWAARVFRPLAIFQGL